MFNLKWSALAGAGVFILSLLIGLLTGAGFIALIRALVFGALFLAIGLGGGTLIRRFLPELAAETAAAPEPPPPGDGEAPSRVDISVGDGDDMGELMADSAAPSGAALDQNIEKEYTKGGQREVPKKEEPKLWANAPAPQGGGAKPKGSSSGPGENFDPKELAQAIQTLLKREEQG